MRYREGMEVDAQAKGHVNQGMLVGTSVFGLLAGAILCAAGVRARLLWLSFWGGGLVVASFAYIGFSLYQLVSGW